MTQTHVAFLDFKPTLQVERLFNMRIDQFLDFLPLESQAKLLVRKVHDSLTFHGYLLMTTAWGEFRVAVNEKNLEDLLERLGAKLKRMVNSKRRMLGMNHTENSSTARHASEREAFDEINSVEQILATGG